MKNNGYSKKNLPDKKLLEDLYIVQNKTIKEVADILGIVPYTLGEWMKSMGIVKTKKQVVQCQKRLNMEKYGVECTLLTPENKVKSIQTLKKHYGVDHPYKSEEIVKKSSDKRKSRTQEEKQDTREKTKQTIINRYGSMENYMSITTEKREQTCLNKFGVTNVFLDKEWQSKAHSNHISKHGALNTFLLENFTQEQRDILDNGELLKEFIQNQIYKTPPYIASKLGYTCSTAGSIIINKCQKFGILDCLDLRTNGSKMEADVFDYVKSIYKGNIIRNTKSVIGPYELDIYLPDINVAVEFNGSYWHCEEYVDKFYHLRKTQMCMDKGILLYHIFEYEWEDNIKQQIIKSQLNNIMGISKKIYARRTYIKNISLKECAQFLKYNHLQGEDRSSIKLGLYTEDLGLVQVMTFGKPRFNKSYEYELIRLCTLKDYCVVGGASKLWKYFVSTYNPNSVISYCSLDKSKGNIYSQLGMVYIKNTEPGYSWYLNRGGLGKDIILSRYKCQMKNEVDIMQSQGYRRIYNCGNSVWKYIKNIGV